MRICSVAVALVCSALAAPYCLGSSGGQVLFAVGSGVTGGASELYQISNYATAPASIQSVSTGFIFADVAVDPTSGSVYGMRLGNEGRFYRLDPSTGAATFVGQTPGVMNINALEFDLTGQAYGWSEPDGNLYRIDKTTGVATAIGAVGFPSGGDLAFDADGTLYGSTLDSLIRIDPTTGAGTMVGLFGVSPVYGLEIDLDGTMYAGVDVFANQPRLHRVNKDTGAATFVGQIAGPLHGLHGLSFTQTPIPEPASLLLPGVAASAAMSRRRR